MRKSEIYRYAIMSVIRDSEFHASTKLEIIEELMDAKVLHEMVEKNKEEQKHEQV